MRCSIVEFPRPAGRRRHSAASGDAGRPRAKRSSEGAPGGPDGFALALLDKLHRGVIVTDPYAAPLFVNRAAAAIAQRGDGLSLDGGRLLLLHAEAQRSLKSFMARTRSKPDSASDTLVLKVARSNNLPPYRLLAMRLEGIDDATKDRGRCFGIFVYEPHGGRFIPTKVLTDLYGLSLAQAQLTAKLFQGPSLEESARSLGISFNTAKTHLKQVFFKCEVRSRAELLQLLALGPRTL